MVLIEFMAGIAEKKYWALRFSALFKKTNLRFCSSIWYGSLIVVCEAITTLVFVYMAVLDLLFTIVK